MGLDLDLIVYLRTTPDVAFERMRSRGRKEESGAPLDYIKALHKVRQQQPVKYLVMLGSLSPNLHPRTPKDIKT